MVYQWDTELVILQAESREDLIGGGERLLGFISANPEVELKDIAYTLNCPKCDATMVREQALQMGGMPQGNGVAMQRGQGLYPWCPPNAPRGKGAAYTRGSGLNPWCPPR